MKFKECDAVKTARIASELEQIDYLLNDYYQAIKYKEDPLDMHILGKYMLEYFKNFRKLHKKIAYSNPKKLAEYFNNIDLSSLNYTLYIIDTDDVLIFDIGELIKYLSVYNRAEKHKDVCDQIYNAFIHYLLDYKELLGNMDIPYGNINY